MMVYAGKYSKSFCEVICSNPSNCAMIYKNELRRIARARLKDAQTLLKAKRYDGVAYLCGYAVELAIKARICRTLKWQGFPETRKEFEQFASFRTHNLDTLLSLTGQEDKIKTGY